MKKISITKDIFVFFGGNMMKYSFVFLVVAMITFY